MTRLCTMLAALLSAILLLTGAARAAEDRRVEASVLRVIDGDTIEVRARVGIAAATFEIVSVRLRGIDTPELRGKCKDERARALAARDFVKAQVTDRVTLSDIGPDKYAGRVDARVTLSDGADLASLLLEAGHGRAYDGGRRQGWCDGQTPAVAQ